ncbi:hypothetical protein [Clostridium beijerinckii]|uniref:hypothetical protein n=2 Tax=Clostridium beijerinckii TaxID=1520 RepID=UPI00098C626F|nr:hypothetical protein [Clostridium beijerinckii]MBA8937728.1 hypothetical protein [Clostridium beijerinckii]NSA95124.1 hypothetical protein [Clostridium beijerinckii]OOM49984.1 hypothetical protein CLBKI_49590 [Clostridium beijerinckii]OOM67000.1 hypothetical protein CLOBI_04870 [Clostridium beijerinckii]CUU51226.1 protein of unknown function [Clostridium beijerinckii]
MAYYTTELRQIVNNSNLDIGLKNYPLYEFKNGLKYINDFGYDLKGNKITNYRDYLNNKIITHFYFREIGYETPALFVFKLNARMNEIMPLYNQMYASTDLEWNPLWNMDLTETFSHEVTDNGNSISKVTGNQSLDGKTTESSESERNEDLEQNSDNTINNNNIKTPNLTNDTVIAEMDTPQENLTVDQIKQHEFLSKATHNINQTTGTETDNGTTEEILKTTNDNLIKTTNDSETKITQTNESSTDSTMDTSNNRSETYTRKQEGNTAGFHAPIALKQWRDNMINVDMMIIEELESLFIGIYKSI